MVAGLTLFGGDLLLFPVLDLLLVQLEGGADGGEPAFDDAFEAVGGEGLDVGLGVAPPRGDDAGQFVAVEEAEGFEFGDEGVEKFAADAGEGVGVGEFGQALAVAGPPVGERLVQAGFGGLGQFGDAFGRSLPAFGEEVVVTRVAFGEEGGGVDVEGAEQVSLGLDLALGDAAVQVGADVLRLGGGVLST